MVREQILALPAEFRPGFPIIYETMHQPEMSRHKTDTYSQKVLDSTIRVEKGSPHSTVDIGSRETHALDLSNDSTTLRARNKCRGIIEGGSIAGGLCSSGGRGGGSR